MPSARPAPHKTPALNPNIYERDLDKNAANHATLTPLQFLERTRQRLSRQLALVHGPRRQTWAETYERCQQLASALEKVGIGSATRWRSWRRTSPRCTRRISACR